MRILVVGGTRFIGRHLVHAALDDGHQVTVFHRGTHGAELFPGVDRRLGDRDADRSALAGTEAWDATIDTCAYLPSQVHALADTLGERGGRYVFISTVAVYAPPSAATGADGPEATQFGEDAPLVDLPAGTPEQRDLDAYGGWKARCEGAAAERFGPASLIVRPTYVVGPHDYSWRFPWWVTRAARGGTVLAPGPRSAPVQVIDVRDLARWTVQALVDGRAGAFHAVGPAQPLTWGELLETIVATIGPPGTELCWVDDEFILRRGLDARDLPLWSGGSGPDADSYLYRADPAAALGAGLRLRPLADTVTDVLAWARRARPAHDVGLDSGHERALVHAWRTEPRRG